VTTAVSRQRLQRSQLRANERQLELLKEDLDVEAFKLQMKSKLSVDVRDRILSCTLEPSVEGATTVTVEIEDSDHSLLRSGRLASRVDVNIEGLWFRLIGVQLNTASITLTFEDREIAVLRTYDKKRIASRTKMTRAEFIRVLVREPKEFRIPCVIPELQDIQAVVADASTPLYEAVNPSGNMGLPKVNDLTVKGAKMTEEQRQNANIILNVATDMVLPRVEMVIGLMVAIQESSIVNHNYGSPGDFNFLSPQNDHNPVGVFQQIKAEGWPASRDVAKDARGFFEVLSKVYASNPNQPYYQLGEEVQHSGNAKAYAPWRTEAERIVSEYGMIPNNPAAANAQAAGSGTSGDYHFFRGVPPSGASKVWKTENSWACIQRLAQEVNWRAWFVSGTFYYMSEQRMLAQRPVATVDHDTVGVEDIGGDYAENTKVATMTLTARLGQFQVPAGSVIKIRNCGPYNGRWIVSSISRSLFDSQATLNLVKPRPKLPEPAQDQLQLETSWGWTGSPAPQTPGTTPPTAQNVLSAKGAAEKLIQYNQLGQFRDDDGHIMEQVRAAAAGKTVRNQCGHNVTINPAVLSALVSLIEDEHLWVGCFALCSDHSCLTDTGSQSQHPLGQAVDISSLGSDVTGWRVIGDGNTITTGLMKQAMRYLQPLAWQMICNGNGRVDHTIEAMQINQGKVQGGWWVDDHLNHIHFSVAGSGLEQ
jgi:hypothetical protein